jgi:phosphoribosyl-ATP pyrophosphohydrolase
MIVPKLNLDIASLATGNSREQLLAEIRHASLFGSACLVCQQVLSESQLQQLGRVVKQSSGFVNLQLQLAGLDDASALELLNIGAARIVVAPDERDAFESIPDDRILVLRSSADGAGQGDQVVVQSPTAQQLIDLEKQRIDACVDSAWLDQNSETVVDYYCGVLKSDRPDGLWSTIICDSLGIALGLAYSNRESLLHAIAHRQGAYWSRSRGGLWVKGLTSGATQALHAIRFDCDADCLRFTVTQDPPGFCHRKTHTCFGEERSIATVVQRLKVRIDSPDEKSFTRKLANDGEMLQKKLLEEAGELAEANEGDDRYEVAWEAADVMYFSLVAMLNNGVGLEEVYAELARRMNRIVRRKNKLES